MQPPKIEHPETGGVPACFSTSTRNILYVDGAGVEGGRRRKARKRMYIYCCGKAVLMGVAFRGGMLFVFRACVPVVPTFVAWFFSCGDVAIFLFFVEFWLDAVGDFCVAERVHVD